MLETGSLFHPTPRFASEFPVGDHLFEVLACGAGESDVVGVWPGVDLRHCLVAPVDEQTIEPVEEGDEAFGEVPPLRKVPPGGEQFRDEWQLRGSCITGLAGGGVEGGAQIVFAALVCEQQAQHSLDLEDGRMGFCFQPVPKCEAAFRCDRVAGALATVLQHLGLGVPAFHDAFEFGVQMRLRPGPEPMQAAS